MGDIRRITDRYDQVGFVNRVDREESVNKALQCLAEHDLGFGGRVTQISEANDECLVEVRVSIFGNVDICRYIGSSADMHLLKRLAELHQTMWANRQRGQGHSDVVACHLTAGGSPIARETIVGLLNGSNVTRRSLVLILALEHYQENDPAIADVLRLCEHLKTSQRWEHGGFDPISDLLAAHELAAADPETSLLETLRLALPRELEEVA